MIAAIVLAASVLAFGGLCAFLGYLWGSIVAEARMTAEFARMKGAGR